MLYDPQVESVRRANARLNIWDGSVRSGKTIASIVRWLRYCAVDGPPGGLLMIGKTERTLARNVLDPIIDLVGHERCKVKGGAGEAQIMGRTVWLAGANDESAAARIRGLTLAGAYGDEVSLWPRNFFTMLLSRLSVTGAKAFFTTNPDSPMHWLKRDYLDRSADLDLARFQFRLSDNPGLDPDYVHNLTAEYTGLWRSRFIDGLWVAAEGAIYDMLDVNDGGKHVRICPSDVLSDPRTVFTVGVDYGTVNPFVALLIARDAFDRMWVLDEWRWDSAVRQRQQTDHEYAVAVNQWIQASLPTLVGQHLGAQPEPATLAAMFIDPSASSFIEEIRRTGLPAQPADNSVIDGIRTVATRLSSGTLFISPSCSGLLAEMAGYTWDPKAQISGQDRPTKADDHGPDALRYAVMGSRYATPGAMISTSW